VQRQVIYFLKSKDIKKALVVIDLYKEEFIKAWHEYHGNE
jgi:hypothetical protein